MGEIELNEHILDGIKPGKTLNALKSLAKAGVFMDGNATLEGSITSYRVKNGDYEFLQLMTSSLSAVLNPATFEIIQVKSLIQESVEDLREWVSEDVVSKKLLGQTILMKLAYPNFDQTTLVKVAKHRLSVASFIDVIIMGKGELDDDFLVVGELPDFLREALKDIN